MVQSEQLAERSQKPVAQQVLPVGRCQMARAFQRLAEQVPAHLQADWSRHIRRFDQ